MSKTREARKPKDQAVQDPTGRRAPTAPATTLIQEPAETLYLGYWAFLRENSKPGHVPPRGKPWFALAAVERAAWRHVNALLDAMIRATERIVVPPPDPDTATVLISDGLVYKAISVNRTQIRKAILTRLLEDIDKTYEDNPKLVRPAPEEAEDDDPDAV